MIIRPSIQNSAHQTGFSLVEMMVAVTIGLLIMAGLVGVFVKSNKAREEVEKANRQIENGRYAIQLLTDDLRMAGFYGEFDPTVLTPPAAKPDACSSVVADLKAALPFAVQGYDGGATLNCLTGVNVLAGTDILVVRRASTCIAGSANCDPSSVGATYFQASLCNGSTELGSTSNNFYAIDTNTANLKLHKRDCTTLADLRRYRTHIYFIDSNDNDSDGIPTLKRAELGAGGFNIVPLVEGIENFQVEYGIDTNCDGGADVYTAAPDAYAGTYTAPCTPPLLAWQNVVSVKLHVLARNTDQTIGYTDQKAYTLGLKADGSPNTIGPFSDSYKRHVYETVVRLTNPAGRITQ